MKIRPVLIALAVFWFSVHSIAQQYPFVYYTPKDGLVNPRVRKIKQDSKGQMYFITYGGLSVYDGVSFKNYNQLDGLITDLVNDIIEVGPDSFLVATNAGSVNTLVRGKIGIFQTSDKFYPVINRFFKSGDGFIYAAADNGFFKLSGKNFTKIPLINDQGKDIAHNLDRITEWNNYFLIQPWTNTQDANLIIYDKGEKRIAAVLASKSITNAVVTPAGDLWVSSKDGIESLDLLALRNGMVQLNSIPELEGAKEYKLIYLYFDDNNDLWLSHGEGAIHISSTGEKQLFSASQGLVTSNLSDLMVDREGMIWMASDGNGVIKLPGTDFYSLGELVQGKKNGILALHQQQDTTWLFSRTNNSIYEIYNGRRKTYSLGSNPRWITNIYVIGESLYFTSGQNIYKVANKHTPSSYLQPHPIIKDNTQILDFGSGILDPHGNIIQCVLLDENNYSLFVLSNDQVVMDFKLSFITDQMAVDRNRILWVPTRDHHLLALSLHPEAPDQYLRVEHDYANEIKGINPRSITIDSTGDIWIGTRYSGVFRFHLDNGKLISSSQLTTNEGLTDNFNWFMHSAPGNHVWIGSQSGLDKIYFENGNYRVENVTRSKNIFGGIYKIVSVARNNTWALTSEGEIIVSEGSLLEKKLPTPQLFMTSLIVNEKDQDLSNNLFSYDQNNLSVSVASPSFLDERSILYSYLLKGSGKNYWSKPSNNAAFNFINLAPGDYTVRIKADYPAGIYPSQELAYSFSIQPPYWRTWWFFTLGLLFSLGIYYIAARFYYAKKLEKQRMILESKRALEKERTRIATDMHDDLGAGLTRIKFLSETIGIKKQLHLPVEDEIQGIRTNAHEMIDKMGEIVWALNERNDTLSDLFAFTRAYAVNYLAENGLKSIVVAPDDIPAKVVTGEFRRNIYLCVKEALHNIIKHAEANAVTMKFEMNQDLKISIHDNGIGFNPDKTHPYSNGLVNMKKRMASLGGTMEVKNENGTHIHLSAPLPS